MAFEQYVYKCALCSYGRIYAGGEMVFLRFPDRFHGGGVFSVQFFLLYFVHLIIIINSY